MSSKVVKAIPLLLVLLFLIVNTLGASISFASDDSSKPASSAFSEFQSFKSLEPNEHVLLWIDIEGRVDISGNIYLPRTLSPDIHWIMFTFDPKPEKNDLLWALAETEAEKLPRILNTPWVRNVTLLKAGRFTEVSENSKFAMKGMGHAIQRAKAQGNASLQVIVYLEERTSALENVTSTIEKLGGEILRTGPYKNKVLALVPSQMIEKLADNPNVSEMYLQGPLLMDGLASDGIQYTSYVSQKAIENTNALIVGVTTICFVVAYNNRRRRGFSLLWIVILSSAFLMTLPPVNALDTSTAAIRATDTWSLGIDGTGINVAIIDSGINYTHPDFPQGAIRLCFTYGSNEPPMDFEGHGTQVAGIIAGRGVINAAYKGVAPGAHIIMIKTVFNYDLDDAINWVKDNKDMYDIKVLSLSVSAPGEPKGGDGTSVYSKAVDDAIDAGIVVVKSAGNKGHEGSKTIVTPGDAFNVITVGAVDDKGTTGISDDTLWQYSSRGPTGDEQGGRPKPDVVAPGVNIISTNASGGYIEDSGTSFAAPHVSGTVALMLQANPNLTPAQVKAILRQTARLNDNLSPLEVNDRGHGIIDAYAAVQLAQNIDDIEIGQMWDSWDVRTPIRDLGWPTWDQLWFTIDAPSSTFGIAISDVRYQYTNPLGGANYKLINRLSSAKHMWKYGFYYDLGSYMNEYLLSGPRILSKGSGYAEIQAWYSIGGDVMIRFFCKLHVDKIWLWLDYYDNGGAPYRTLIYIDTEVKDTTNFPHLPSTSETIYFERKLMGEVLNVRDLGQTEYVQIDPVLGMNQTMWVLTPGYTGSNPESALNEEYTYDRDIVVYYQGDSNQPGLTISRETDSLPAPDPPPTTPSRPSGPTSGLIYTIYDYTTSSTDPAGDTIHYQFDWGGGSRSWTDWYASGANATGYHYWSTPGTKNVKIRAQDSHSAWSDWSQILEVRIWTPPPSGCPYVSTWNGSSYALDNNILPASEVSKGTDVEDYYKLEQALVPNWEGRLFSIYSLKLSEFENEHSYIDQVRLLAVDHDSDVNIAITPDGEILTYRNPTAPLSAIDNYGNNRLGEISQMDGNISDPATYFYGTPYDYLILNFGQINSDNAKLILRDDMIKKDECIEVQVKDNNGTWQTVDTVLPRAYWSIEAVNLSPYVINGQDFWVRLFWINPHRLDFVGLDTTTQENYELHTSTLVSAVHSTEGNVKTQLLTSDNFYAELIPDQYIILAFRLPNNTKQARTYIFYTEGHYYAMT